MGNVDCMDCGIETQESGNYYMINTDLWVQAVPHKRGMLCIPCLEARLGRELTHEDFTDCYVNCTSIGWHHSELLEKRLEGKVCQERGSCKCDLFDKHAKR